MFGSRNRRVGLVVAVLSAQFVLSLPFVASASATEPKCGFEGSGKTFVNPEYVGFQTSKGELGVYEWQGKKFFETGLTMAPSSSPDLEFARSPRRVVAAFQGGNEHLWFYTPNEACLDTGYGMRVGTNASGVISPEERYVAAFQSGAGQLWSYTVGAGPANTTLNMAADTSPSAVVTPNGRYIVAFRSSEGQLWDYTLGAGTFDTTLNMAADTSPSAVIYPTEYYAVAFQSSGGNLWVYSPGEPPYNTSFAMAPGTSPSAVETGGNFAVAFQGANGDLWTYSLTLGTHDTGLAMRAGTSPSIGPKQTFPGGGGSPAPAFVVYFQGTNGHLWRYAPYFFPTATDTGFSMREGTSPGVASIP